jgi:hypothetical protein
MAHAGEMDVRNLRIERDHSLGRGATTSQVLRCVAPDGQRLLFKEYRPETRAELDGAALVAHVRWRLSLAPDVRRRLDTVAAWPQAVVREGRAVMGVLMQEAPDRFFEGAGSTKPRNGTALARDAAYCKQYGRAYIPAPRKLAALGHLIETLGFLHGLGTVVGDLQPLNVLTTGASGTPEVYLLDCDAYLIDGATPFPALRDPLPWRVPGETRFSTQTDLYKAALMVARCLHENMALRTFTPAMFRDILPTGDVAVLLGLTADDRSRRVRLSADDLRPMASAWRSLVTRDGHMHVRNDRYVMAPWPLPQPLGSPPAGSGRSRVPVRVPANDSHHTGQPSRRSGIGRLIPWRRRADPPANPQ